MTYRPFHIHWLIKPPQHFCQSGIIMPILLTGEMRLGDVEGFWRLCNWQMAVFETNSFNISGRRRSVLKGKGGTSGRWPYTNGPFLILPWHNFLFKSSNLFSVLSKYFMFLAMARVPEKQPRQQVDLGCNRVTAMDGQEGTPTGGECQYSQLWQLPPPPPPKVFNWWKSGHGCFNPSLLETTGS